MNLKLHRVHLPLEHPFTISRGTMTTQASVYVELEHDGISGLGEATENSFYGHTFDSIEASLERIRPHLSRYLTESPLDLWDEMCQLMGGDMFALSALDMAAHDLRGKRSGIPTWKDWGLEWDTVVPSSFTIGIDKIDKMVEKLNQRPGWPVYKIKLGTGDDLDLIRELRRHTDAKFRVDANCAWSVTEAIEKSHSLEELNVEFIEQPLPIDASSNDKRQLYLNSALPIIADEDCQVISDVAACHGHYHGINVKICKCGGLTPALKMLNQARELEMKTMVGCMIESAVGISAAAQLLPLLDFADLDGAILLRDQPAHGVDIDQGRVARPDGPGCGSGLDFNSLPSFQA